jgi:hypothetical protein
MKFKIECDIPDRWVPYFVGMIKTHERLGSLGSSRSVIFYADGDGDYRPHFKFFPEDLPEASPDKETLNAPGGEYFYDAG